MEIRLVNKQTPSVDEITKWITSTGAGLKSFFNTNGKKYKEMGLKDKWDSLSETELLELLCSDFMLFKRPVLIGKDFVLSGFKKVEWEEKLLQKI